MVGLYARDSTKPVCLGTIVRNGNNDDRWVLTAAHCIDGSVPLKIGLPSGGGLTPAIRALRHPRYVEGAPESPYDIALISFDERRLLDARSIAVAAVALQAGRSVWLPEQTESGRRLRHVAIQRNDIRPLRVRLDDTKGGWCRGDSGAPLLAVEPTGLVVIGVMSGGEATCNGNAYAARLTTDVLEVLGSPRAARSLWAPANQTCSECVDENSAGAGRCLTGAQLCAASSRCTVLEQGLFNAIPDTDELALNRLESNEAGLPLWRCICVAACSVACSASCAPRRQ
jgi:hypothetical protein